MSTKPPPPCPPPRPDLEDESDIPPSKPSKRGPPPIPLRPDLGEGVDDHASSSVHIPKIPPPTLPKKPSFKRSQGKPEITIISAQPLASSGAFSPFVPTVSEKPAPLSEAVRPPAKPNGDLTPLSKSTSGPPATASYPAVFGSNSGEPVISVSHSTAHEAVLPLHKPNVTTPLPKPIPGPPSAIAKPAVPISQNKAAFSPFGNNESFPPTRSENQPAFSPFGDDFSHSVQNANSGSTDGTFSDPLAPPVQPLKPPTQMSPQMASVPAPQPLKPPPKIPAPNIAPAQSLRPAPPGPPISIESDSTLQFSRPPPPGPPIPTASDSILLPSRPAPPGPPIPIASDSILLPSRPAPPGPPIPTASDSTLLSSRPAPPVPTNVSPLKVSTKANKPRAPPQRPKSKPVCEPSLTNDPFQVGLASNESERLADPIAPKRKKNKASQEAPQDAAPLGSGINNSAFQDVEPNRIDNSLKMDEDAEIQKEKTTKKAKFPTVIRTKPNGKEAPKKDSTSTNLDDLKQLEFDSNKVKYTKPTVIKPQARAKPPPPPSKKADPGSTEQLTAAPEPEPEPQQTKSKPKPTIIISKAKKDETKKTEVMASPAEPSKSEIETKKDPTDKAKPKRIPSIIRPNRAKKGKNQATDSQDPRGMPEGQSHESPAKIIPARKAPPRPSPPKPGPPRPGPPKRADNAPAPTRTQPIGNVTNKDIHSENTHKGQALPRPATIGRDPDADSHKGVVKHKKKKEETTVVSSVVATKIEPSCIALYDYDSGNPDDLSFKAGDEVFLVKRIDQEWYIGRLNDCEGMIPIKFVEIIEDLPPESETPKSKVADKTSSLTTVALYDFDGQAHDELTFHAGDIILLTEKINNEWLRGTCNGATGMFPSNFVDFTPEMEHKLSESKSNKKQTHESSKATAVNDVTSGPRCKALYDYHTDNDSDLNFNQDDIIKLVERINDDWLKGEAHEKVGMFPAAYADIIEDLVVSPGHSSQESSSFVVAEALHDYISDADGDLSFKQGDMITIIKRINDEWLEGEIHGHRGMFPAAFVETAVGESTQNASQIPPAHLVPKGRALYDFTGETEHELTFKAGDEILLLKHINDDWMEGELNDNIGQFPTAFIEVLIPLP